MPSCRALGLARGQRLIGHRYPEPVVDVAAAARAARDRIWQARQAAGFAETAAGIVRRHASRADPRFVNDRSPRRACPRRN
jgi:deoxyribodipyrimidine photo-lyase